MTKDTPTTTPAEPKQTGTEINRSDLHAAPVYAELVESLLAQLEVFFSGKMAELFVAVDEHLFASADQAKNTAEQNRLFEFMNALRKKREAIGKSFFLELNKYLRPIAVSKELPKKKHHAPPGQTGLSLIDQDEMDEMITLTTITGKAAMDCREELSHLEARLEHLALQNRNIFHPKALDPTHICDAFQESLVTSEFDKVNKLILYKMFGSEVVKNLKQLYDDLNGSMIRAGVLPQIEHTGKIRRTREARQRNAEQASEAENLNAEQQQGPMGRGGQQGGYYSARGGAAGAGGSSCAGGSAAGSGQSAAGAGYGTASGASGSAGGYGSSGVGAAAGGGNTGVAGVGGTGGAGRAGGGSGGTSGAGVSVGASGSGGQGSGAQGGAIHGASSAGGGANQTGNVASTANANDQRMSAGFPAGQIRSRIAGFVGGDPVTADTSGGAGADGAVYYTRQEVVTALSGMQNVTDVSSTAPLQFNAAAIKKAVLASIGERSGGTLTKRVNQISEKTIDFIKLIFDAIIDDKGISDTIKALLLSLQIPIIKAAMLDADFFIDDKHPARQLLDRIAEAGVGVNDRNDAVCVELTVIVRKLLKEYHEDIGAFSVALESIKALTDRIYEAARNTEKLSQEQVKHTHARTIVLQEIRKITLGKELAPGIRVLVMKIWPSLMFNYYLRHGKANDEWVEMLMILAKIIDSVQPHYSLDDLKDLGLSYDDVITSVTEKLRKFRKTEDVIEQAILDLRETYEKLDSKRVVKARDDVADVVTADAVKADKSSADNASAEITAPSFTPIPKRPVQKSAVESLAEASMEMAADGEATETNITPEKAARSKLDKLPPEVQPGSWFIVYNGENKPVRRLKLAVILMQDATMVFVDHLGNVVVEKDVAEFAEELVRGASGIIMQHSVFDHALRSALQTIPQH
jgi:hypothetical protein